MSRGLYELVALGARYAFAALMVLIVLRAWRLTLIDSRRAAALRRLSPQTGLSGELLVLEGDEKARRGMRYPVIREGMIGSSRRADVRIRHSSVRRKHAYFQLTDAGLSVRARPDASMRDGEGRRVRSLTLPDGGEFSLGRVRLLLVLNEAPEPAAPVRRERRGEIPDPFDEIPDGYSDIPGDRDDDPIDPDDLFSTQPVLRRGRSHEYRD